MKGKVHAMAFLDKNGGSEEEKKLLAELNLLGKKTTTKVKEVGEEKEMKSTNNGKRFRFQPSSSQHASLLAAFEHNSLPSAEAKKALADEIGMAVKSVGFWFVNYKAKITKKGKVATLPEAKEGEEKENVEASRFEEKVPETKFGSENETLQLISLLPGVNIKPIFNKVDSDEKEAKEEEKKVLVVDEEVTFNFNIENSLNDEDTEDEEVVNKTQKEVLEEPMAMDVEPAQSEENSRTEEIDNVEEEISDNEEETENNSDDAEENLAAEENSEAEIPESVSKALEEADQIEIVENDTVEDVSEETEDLQSTNDEEKEEHKQLAKDETEEQNQNETLPKGWKRKGSCKSPSSIFMMICTIIISQYHKHC